MCIYCVAIYIYDVEHVQYQACLTKLVLFPGSIKNLHIFCTLLYSNLTLCTPNCVIVVLLYVLKLGYIYAWLLPIFLLYALGNIFLYKCKGIMLPPLLVSIFIRYYYTNLV